MRKLILRNFQSPGDIVMLTAAVRDLHKSCPGQFLTDVRTSCPALWLNNPYLTPLDESDPSVELIQCHYPLIHSSNTAPWHFIHGFIQYLSERLKVPIRPTEFKGDIHLHPSEKEICSQLHELIGASIPFWIIAAGGKQDFTIKWWSHQRFQSVVDSLRGRLLFVQVGESGHVHPPLKGVIDLRGKTDLRQLVRLVYHAQGIVSPVTLLMHLAAAVETKSEMRRNRPCVVVAGGREPSQWEAYPHHQFIHTNGALTCCEHGGCWKSRTTPLGDGDEKDWLDNLCVDVVKNETLQQEEEPPRGFTENALAYPKEDWPQLLPRCMHLISAEEVTRRVELYFKGGSTRYLSAEEVKFCRQSHPNLIEHFEASSNRRY